MKKKQLILIQSTDATIDGFISKGLWDRQKYTLEEYSKVFNVTYYTSDNKKFKELPNEVEHKVSRFSTNIYGLRHIFFYLYLIKESFFWDKGVIRVFGVTIPILGIIKFFSKLKVVTSFQYDWKQQTQKNYIFLMPKNFLSSIVQSSSIKNSDVVICTMQWLANIAHNEYKAKDVVLIPNYVNTKLFKPYKKKKQIVFAGRLHWSKGVDTLIKVFDNFNNEYKDYKLIILGDGEEKEKLQHLTMNKNIEFCGNISFEKVARIFNESEIFVLPTKTMEGHPKALIEAMASGCKCIASNVPGNKDVLIDAKSSEWLFEPSDENMLYKLIKKAITEEVAFKKQQIFAQNEYSADILFDKELSILKKQLKD